MTTTPDTAPATVLEFTRLKTSDGRGVTLTARDGDHLATVTLVVPGTATTLPTYLWVVGDAPGTLERPGCYGFGYGEGASVACAEATNALTQLGAGPFSAFTVLP